MAEEQELDLVKISPNAVPPVCKIMDYGKFRFDQLKKEKEARKNQRVVEIKEIRMSPGIDTNDLNVKMRNAMKFLKEGNRVKVTVRFRGREMAHTDIGEQLLIRFGEGCAEVANVDKKPKLDGRFMTHVPVAQECKIITNGRRYLCRNSKPTAVRRRDSISPRPVRSRERTRSRAISSPRRTPSAAVACAARPTRMSPMSRAIKKMIPYK